MKMNSKDEIKVGIFAIVGILLVVAMVSFYGLIDFFNSNYELRVVFDKVSGLHKGIKFDYAGVEIGKIKDIIISDNKVVVVLEVEEDIKIPEGAKFAIVSKGFMGDKSINIAPPRLLTGNYIEPNTTIKGTATIDLDRAIETAGRVLEKMDLLLESVNNVLGDKEIQNSLKDTINRLGSITDNLDKFSRDLADVSGDEKGDIKHMVIQFSEMSTKLNQSAGYVTEMLKATDGNGQTGQNLAVIAQNLAEVTSDVKIITNDLTQGAKASNEIKTDSKVSSIKGKESNPLTTSGTVYTNRTEIGETVHNAKVISERAKNLMETIDSMKIQYEIAYTNKADNHWRNDLGIVFEPSQKRFVYIGVADLGEEDSLDFQLGEKVGEVSYRVGRMQDKFGLGFDYRFSPKLEVFTDVYDFNDTKVKLGAEYKLTDESSIVLKSYDITNSGEAVYLGYRSYLGNH